MHLSPSGSCINAQFCLVHDKLTMGICTWLLLGVTALSWLAVRRFAPAVLPACCSRLILFTCLASFACMTHSMYIALSSHTEQCCPNNNHNHGNNSKENNYADTRCSRPCVEPVFLYIDSGNARTDASRMTIASDLLVHMSHRSHGMHHACTQIAWAWHSLPYACL